MLLYNVILKFLWSIEAHFCFMPIQPSFYGDSKTHFTITWTVCTHHSWQQDNLFVFAFSNLQHLKAKIYRDLTFTSFPPLYHNQADGYKSTECVDLKCNGFVPVNYAPITPGDSLEGKSKISIKIFKVQKLEVNAYYVTKILNLITQILLHPFLNIYRLGKGIIY